MKAEGFPIPDYDQLTFPQIMRRLSGLGPQELKLVYKREQSGSARLGVLARIELALGDDFEAILASPDEEPAATGDAASGQAVAKEPAKSALKVMRPAARAAAERAAVERAGGSAKSAGGAPAADATARGAMTMMRPAARAAAAKAAAEREALK